MTNTIRSSSVLSLLIASVAALTLSCASAGAQQAPATTSDVVAKVYFATWCGYCKRLRADVTSESGSEQYLNIAGVNSALEWIDADVKDAQGVSLLKKIGGRGFPTTDVHLGNGQFCDRVVGADLPAIKEAIKRAREGVCKPAQR